MSPQRRATGYGNDWPLTMVISGGQTGADQAGWRAAKALGYLTSGFMPQGFLTEAGCRPEFAQDYSAEVHPDALTYEARTTLNIKIAGATVIFGKLDSPGAAHALRVLRQIHRPKMTIELRPDHPLELLLLSHRKLFQSWIITNRIQVLNVAGNRESMNPGIGIRVERFLLEALKKP